MAGTDSANPLCTRCGKACIPPVITDAKGAVCTACLESGTPRTRTRDSALSSPIDDTAAYALEPDQPDASDRGDSQCPRCAHHLPASARLCTQCGYDRVTDRVVNAAHVAPAAHVASAADMARRSKDRATAREVQKGFWLRPLLMLVIGASIAFSVSVYTGGLGTGAQYLLTYAVNVPLGLGVFWLCCLMWIGFDASMPLTALRLAGIYAAVDVVQLMVPIPVLGWLIPATAYIAMLMFIIDLDLIDALGYAFLTMWVKFGIAFIIAAMLV